jgi:mono/diheme cytochrome c family protein
MGFFRHRATLLSMFVPVAVALAGCSQPASTPATDAPAAPAAPAISPVEKGRLLVAGGGCHDCHTPKKIGPNGPEADLDRSLSGHPEKVGPVAKFVDAKGSPYSTHTTDDLTAWSGAWGVSYAANLTPDETTGIGLWSEDAFVKAIKSGKHMGAGRPILPPMPWFWYNQLPDDDLKAIYAYLKSIPAIQNKVPGPTDPAGKPIS